MTAKRREGPPLGQAGGAIRTRMQCNFRRDRKQPVERPLSEVRL
jgi:hypothetical protein